MLYVIKYVFIKKNKNKNKKRGSIFYNNFI